MHKTISIYDLFKIYQKTSDINVIDLREEYKFNEYHIPGSTSIPRRKFMDSSFELKKSDKPYYIVDYNDEYAEEICNLLDSFGYNTIKVFGGIKRWKGSFK